MYRHKLSSFTLKALANFSPGFAFETLGDRVHIYIAVTRHAIGFSFVSNTLTEHYSGRRFSFIPARSLIAVRSRVARPA